MMATPDFEIVPRRGLAISAVAMVLLIVAIAVNKLWPLEFFHGSDHLFELKKRRPDPEVIGQLMRFICRAGILGVMQIATLVIMTKLTSG